MLAPAMCPSERKAVSCAENRNMQKPRWTKAEIEFVKQHYKRKETDWKLMLQNVKHTREAIVERAGYLGLSVKQANWSGEEIDYLKSNYQTIKVKELTNGLNRTERAIRRFLSKKKIIKQIKWHKYKINHKFFSEWTNESAYVLGLIASDGCVNEGKNHYSVEISSNDKSMLENVRKLMQFTKNVEKSRETFRLRIDNPVIYQDIINKGITHRKSKTLKFPKMPEEIQEHFIRGFFDGDGSIFRLKGKRIIVKFTCFSPPFLEVLQEVLIQKLGVKKKKNHDGSIVYSTKEALTILEWMYQNSIKETRLDRKYERYLKYKGDENSRIDIGRWHRQSPSPPHKSQ